jgi:hypothetical protein
VNSTSYAIWERVKELKKIETKQTWLILEIRKIEEKKMNWIEAKQQNSSKALHRTL